MDQETTNIWYLTEWMEFLGLKQCDIAEKTGWNKAKTNRLYHDKNSYHNDIIITLASVMNIEPYELFMPPQKAKKIRSLLNGDDREPQSSITLHITTKTINNLLKLEVKNGGSYNGIE